MRDPFKIIEPTAISFSGGRTSAYMLWRVLQSNGGLPDEAVVCFANTGKEEATLRFVQRCSDEWNVQITWVEYQAHKEPSQRFKVVDLDTASRNGEPLEAVIRARTSPETTRETMCLPLDDANIRVEDVGEFWSRQPFNLELPTYNGRTLAGNCDLCFLKPANQIFTLIKEKPERAVWWAKMEALALASKPSGARFRSDRPSYQQMLDYARDQGDLFADANEEAIGCFCGD